MAVRKVASSEKARFYLHKKMNGIFREEVKGVDLKVYWLLKRTQ